MVGGGDGVGEWFDAGIKLYCFSEIVVSLVFECDILLFCAMSPINSDIEFGCRVLVIFDGCVKSISM